MNEIETVAESHAPGPGEASFYIRPDDFDLSSPAVLLGTFGKSEVEQTVWRLLKFFQLRGYWCDFTIDELTRFYHHQGWNPNQMFFGLMGGWFDDGMLFSYKHPLGVFLACDPNGQYRVTREFLERCAKNTEVNTEVGNAT